MNKICNRCDKEKELKEFYKHKGLKGGYRPECKKCHGVQSKRIPVKTQDINAGVKKCNKCHKNKELNKFFFDIPMDSFRTKCKECLQEQQVIYKKENKEKVYLFNKKWRIKNKDKISIKAKLYTQKPEVRIKIRNREK